MRSQHPRSVATPVGRLREQLATSDHYEGSGAVLLPDGTSLDCEYDVTEVSGATFADHTTIRGTVTTADRSQLPLLSAVCQRSEKAWFILHLAGTDR